MAVVASSIITVGNYKCASLPFAKVHFEPLVYNVHDMVAILTKLVYNILESDLDANTCVDEEFRQSPENERTTS